jgi:hypothetical protein
LTVVKADEKYYARSSDLDGVYEVSSTMAESFEKKLDDFRNKKLFDFGFNDLASLRLRDGETRVAIEKKDDRWVLASDGGREVDSQKVQTLIDSLRNLSATSFASDNAAEMSKYGLDSPTIEADVTQAENSATEKVVATAPSNEHGYAARDGQPTIYEVEKSTVDEIQRSIGDLLAKPEPAGTPPTPETKEQ